MYVKEYGRGDRIFAAFHGWGGTHREFAPLARFLPQDTRLLCPDLPGYGASPGPGAWDLDAIAADMGRELELRLGMQPRTLIGFCSGAVFPLILARRMPETVGRVVMIDPFASVPWYFRIFLRGEFGRRAYSATFQSQAGRAVTDWVVRHIQRQDESFTSAFRDIDHEAVRRYLCLFNRFDVGRFRDLAVATDILYGERTFAEVRRSVERLCELWPHARKFELRGVGHLPLVRGSRQIAAVVFSRETGRA
jgi:pimeloyl-ACP methyl ester carboxylesterase